MSTKARSGRLFWKLLLALWLSMLFSTLVSVAYLKLTNYGPLPLNTDFPHIGPLPLIPLAAAALALLVTGLALAWYLARPLQHLRWALRRAAEAKFDTRVQPLMGSRRDEIVDLAREFDRMAAQLQQLAESRERLMHDISHELRSPLTRMQAAIGLWRQDPAQAPALIERIERESERLDALIDELLTLHRLRGGPELTRERVDLIELLQAIVEDADFEARATGRRVQMRAPDAFVAEVDGELIYRAYENVIRNAVKFTAPGTAVDVTVHCAGDGLMTEVADRGPGVPPAQLEAIFEPFTRLDGAMQGPGAGLGLAIARRAMLRHGGSIDARLREGGGLIVALKLPSAGAASPRD